MKSKKDKIQTQCEYFYDMWEETGDPQWALKIMEMVKDNLVTISPKWTGELKFTEAARITSTCQTCNIKYACGVPCFFKDGLGWHPHCAPNEPEFQNNPFFKKWLIKTSPGAAPVKTAKKKPSILEVDPEEFKRDMKALVAKEAKERNVTTPNNDWGNASEDTSI